MPVESLRSPQGDNAPTQEGSVKIMVEIFVLKAKYVFYHRDQKTRRGLVSYTANNGQLCHSHVTNYNNVSGENRRTIVYPYLDSFCDFIT